MSNKLVALFEGEWIIHVLRILWLLYISVPQREVRNKNSHAFVLIMYLFIYRYSQELKRYSRSIKSRKIPDELPQPSVETFNSISVKCTNINMFAVTEQMGKIQLLSSPCLHPFFLLCSLCFKYEGYVLMVSYRIVEFVFLEFKGAIIWTDYFITSPEVDILFTCLLWPIR